MSKFLTLITLLLFISGYAAADSYPLGWRYVDPQGVSNLNRLFHPQQARPQAPAPTGQQQIQSQAPPAAAAVGYVNNSFSSNTFSSANVYFGNTNPQSSFQWYPAHFYSATYFNMSNVTFNNDGSMVLTSDVMNNNFGLATAIATGVNYGNNNTWAGTTFGGGAYFEAVLKFDPSLVNIVNGWPSFWGNPIEHEVMSPDVFWSGQAANYIHFVEPDFFEYDFTGNYYGGAVHDWYGVWNQTCSNYCNVFPSATVTKRPVPAGTNFNEYHKYGFLWVPATDTAMGYFEYYFDDQITGPRISWAKYNANTDQPPPTQTTPWLYGVVDQQHIMMILGTGISQPMTVRSVNVWQASTSGNIVH